MYTVSHLCPSSVRREKHLKLNTGFCGSYGGSETSVNSIQTELPAPLHAKVFIQLVTTAGNLSHSLKKPPPNQTVF